ncbi:unnamed protein product [Diatraea saccharalis]|uniref:Uncharacterized protein n=1 Tax=Diatraea saccharalis TaxID=40085 RepID=A0A9N9WI58_9NEOP|nr:unnamed protein product [Diatraea saccharalis]
MSHLKNKYKLAEKIKIDTQATHRNEDEGTEEEAVSYDPTETCTYAVTVSKKTSPCAEEESALCAGQKSFISIHSTDQLCQVADIENPLNLDECHVEVLSLNEVFPSTSEESLSNEDDSPVQRKHRNKNKTATIQKCQSENAAKSGYVPTNSKSSTQSGRQKEQLEGQSSGYSDFDIPKSTMYVMKKFLRNIDKHKNEQNSKINEKALSKLTTMRGILKDGRCGPECTAAELAVPFPMDFCPQPHFTKQSSDKNVTFNTQVVIIHFSGDLCVGQSVETLSKEKDQQARNSELRKTFLTKYNEFWPTQK